MDAPDESLEERTRRVKAVLAVVSDDPALSDNLRPSVEDAVERLDSVLAEGVEEQSTPETLFDTEPVDPPQTEGSRPLNELFDDSS